MQTMIRHKVIEPAAVDANLVAVVLTGFNIAGVFEASFQSYKAYDNGSTQLYQSRTFASEKPALQLYDDYVAASGVDNAECSAELDAIALMSNQEVEAAVANISDKLLDKYAASCFEPSTRRSFNYSLRKK
jgi:hypothetical protein